MVGYQPCVDTDTKKRIASNQLWLEARLFKRVVVIVKPLLVVSLLVPCVLMF